MITNHPDALDDAHAAGQSATISHKKVITVPYPICIFKHMEQVISFDTSGDKPIAMAVLFTAGLKNFPLAGSISKYNQDQKRSVEIAFEHPKARKHKLGILREAVSRGATTGALVTYFECPCCGNMMPAGVANQPA